MTSPDSQLERLRRGAVDLIDEADFARKLRKGPLTVKVGFSSRSRCTSSSLRWPRATTRSRSRPTSSSAAPISSSNLLVGRDLMRSESLEPQVVMTRHLLVGTEGVEKMSKLLGPAAQRAAASGLNSAALPAAGV